MPTSRYCDHSPRSISAARSASASAEPGFTLDRSTPICATSAARTASASRRVALGLLLHHPLQQAGGEGDARRLDRLQVDGRQQPGLGGIAPRRIGVAQQVLDAAEPPVGRQRAQEADRIGQVEQRRYGGHMAAHVEDAIRPHQHHARARQRRPAPTPARSRCRRSRPRAARRRRAAIGSFGPPFRLEATTGAPSPMSQCSPSGNLRTWLGTIDHRRSPIAFMQAPIYRRSLVQGRVNTERGAALKSSFQSHVKVRPSSRTRPEGSQTGATRYGVSHSCPQLRVEFSLTDVRHVVIVRMPMRGYRSTRAASALDPWPLYPVHQRCSMPASAGPRASNCRQSLAIAPREMRLVRLEATRRSDRGQ